jgi:integrase/recombinase XerD
MTRLRQRMLDISGGATVLPIRSGYIRAVQQFAEYFGRSPEQLGAEELRRYQIHLLYERKLALGTVENNISALRFLYKRTLKQKDFEAP